MIDRRRFTRDAGEQCRLGIGVESGRVVQRVDETACSVVLREVPLCRRVDLFGQHALAGGA